MSALDGFNDFCFSEWYIFIVRRILFPCKTEEEIKSWEDKVSDLFSGDPSAVRFYLI